ncbi:MAG: helix-turn-helix domain-containing protein [Deltaproteobacteria bacterium]|nr:helix-turn-helix domain-containing protein [Deltaproteobacteria bacterium]
MKRTFYETLLVPRDADPAVVRAAWEQAQIRVRELLKAAHARGDEAVRLEDERVALDEAWAVLSDPARRARYDRFLDLAERSTAHTADELWDQVAASWLDPAARGTLDLVRLLTDLPVVEGLPSSSPALSVAPPPPVPPPSEGVHGEAGPRLRVPPPLAVAPDTRPMSVVVEEAEPTDPGSQALPDVSATDLPTLVRQHGWSGALVRRVRELRGVELGQISTATHISERYLAAIEADDFGHLPAQTFVRGYLEQVGRILGLDEASLVEGYIARMTRGR